MMELADELGRQTVHEVVYEHAMAALEGGRDFGNALKNDERITGAISEERLAELSDPTAYTGLSGELVRRAVKNSRERSD